MTGLAGEGDGGGEAEVLWRGCLRPGQVRCVRTGRSYAVPAELGPVVEAAWAEGLRSGKRLFDGELVRLEGWQAWGEEGGAAAGGMELRLGRMTYKPFYALHMACPASLPDDDSLRPNVLGVSAAVVLACGRVVMGRRGATVAYYPGRLHPVAGGMEVGDADVFAAAVREVSEELALPAGVLGAAELSLVGLVRDPVLRQPEAVVRVAVGVSAAEVGMSGDEHTELLAVEPRRVLGETTGRWAELTPVGRTLVRRVLEAGP
ncbi:MAG: NUDIX domain-containing protein [Tepidisphaerales bacterium]